MRDIEEFKGIKEELEVRNNGYYLELIPKGKIYPSIASIFTTTKDYDANARLFCHSNALLKEAINLSNAISSGDTHDLSAANLAIKTIINKIL